MSSIKIEYVDHMGTDKTVVNSARVSFNKQIEVLEDKDIKLIKYLSKHNHFTPFTHCMVTIRETVPIFVARQRFKHTVGFSYNEMSRRYVTDVPEIFVPDGWRLAAENVKQGSSDDLVPDEVLNKTAHFTGDSLLDNIRDCQETAVNLYESMIRLGFAAEQARMVLPQSVMTSYYVTGSLSAWARAYGLRSYKTAQKEIRDVADRWDDIIRPLFPHSWDALTTKTNAENSEKE